MNKIDANKMPSINMRSKSERSSTESEGLESIKHPHPKVPVIVPVPLVRKPEILSDLDITVTTWKDPHPGQRINQWVAAEMGVQVATWPTYRQAEFTAGIIWIFLIILLLYCYHEQIMLQRFPHHVISLLLVLMSIARCIWFFLQSIGFPSKSDLNSLDTVLNRVAILIQFSSLLLLILMWGRILKPTSKEITNSLSTSNGSVNVATINDVEIIDNVAIDDAPNYTLWRRVFIVINFIVWAFILLTLPLGIYDSDVNEVIYNLNIILLSSLCSFEAICVLIAGIAISLQLSKELTPTFSSGAPISRLRSVSVVKSYLTILSFLKKTHSHNVGLECQRIVMRKLLCVASITSVFFFVRSILFIYFDGFVNRGMKNGATLSLYTYPYFFYIFPEIIPTLVIAYTISPLNGVLTIMGNQCIGWYLAISNYFDSCMNKNVYATNYIRDSDTSAYSVTPNILRGKDAGNGSDSFFSRTNSAYIDADDAVTGSDVTHTTDKVGIIGSSSIISSNSDMSRFSVESDAYIK